MDNRFELRFGSFRVEWYGTVSTCADGTDHANAVNSWDFAGGFTIVNTNMKFILGLINDF